MTAQYPPPYGQPDPQQWRQPHSHQAPPAKPKRKKWPWIVGAVVLLFLIVGIVNSGDPAPQTPPVVVPPTPSATPRAAAPAAEPASAAPRTSFGDGTWVVGEDIAAGTYRSAGAKEGVFELCSVTTHSDENADADKSLDWKTANVDEPIRLTVSGKVKSVKATGCEDFVKVK